MAKPIKGSFNSAPHVTIRVVFGRDEGRDSVRAADVAEGHSGLESHLLVRVV